MNKKIITALCDHGACISALDWLATQPDPITAWQECPSGEWMWWWLLHIGEPPTLEASMGFAQSCETAAYNYLDTICTIAAQSSPRITDTIKNWIEGWKKQAQTMAKMASHNCEAIANTPYPSFAASLAICTARTADNIFFYLHYIIYIVDIEDAPSVSVEQLRQANWIREHIPTPNFPQ
jgi:hypothetical protein